MKKHYDILDQGDVYVMEEWKQTGGDWWKTKAEAIVMNEFAEDLGVPHGSRIKGTFWVQVDDPNTTPDTGEWIAYGFDEFEIIEWFPTK